MRGWQGEGGGKVKGVAAVALGVLAFARRESVPGGRFACGVEEWPVKVVRTRGDAADICSVVPSTAVSVCINADTIDDCEGSGMAT